LKEIRYKQSASAEGAENEKLSAAGKGLASAGKRTDGHKRHTIVLSSIIRESISAYRHSSHQEDARAAELKMASASLWNIHILRSWICSNGAKDFSKVLSACGQLLRRVKRQELNRWEF
jgi:hypothetical protein